MINVGKELMVIMWHDNRLLIDVEGLSYRIRLDDCIQIMMSLFPRTKYVLENTGILIRKTKMKNQNTFL